MISAAPGRVEHHLGRCAVDRHVLRRGLKVAEGACKERADQDDPLATPETRENRAQVDDIVIVIGLRLPPDKVPPAAWTRTCSLSRLYSEIGNRDQIRASYRPIACAKKQGVRCLRSKLSDSFKPFRHTMPKIWTIDTVWPFVVEKTDRDALSNTGVIATGGFPCDV